MNDRRKNLSLAEIGRRFHVSAATVSNILNNKGKFSPELAGKILAFVDEVEYRPNLLAQSLKGNSKIVGFCLRGNLEDPWYIRVMAEVQNGLRRHGFYVGTVLGEQDLLQVRQTLDLFIQLRAAAVVLGPLGYTAEYEELRPVLDKLNFVTAFDTLEPMPLPSVRVNVYRAACDGVRHLYDCGHRRIGYIGPKTPALADRYSGYHHTVHELALPFNDGWLVPETDSLGELESGLRRVCARPDRPTAFFCQSDLIAMRAMKALYRLGFRVPEDFSLLGVNNTRESELSIPGLSTMGFDSTAYADAIVATVLDGLDGKIHPENASRTVNPVLVKRESVKMIPAENSNLNQ
ncbi:LacI family DNA-binding transcriptional regulator [Victivallis vadensis]|uniref:LacI family DNA-binding transcriptional regulator n=1 Tax=Victivallis vadensis TaxID=172901 RepID=UPI00307D1E6E